MKSSNEMSQPQLLEAVLHFFQVEVEGAELFQFAVFPVLRNVDGDEEVHARELEGFAQWLLLAGINPPSSVLAPFVDAIRR